MKTIAKNPSGSLDRATKYTQKNWAMLLGILILWLLVAGCLIVSSWKNQGFIGYALDDAYIHMAISKNIAQHGTWGVTSREFSSASSSILWSLLLAGFYFIFGNHQIIPLILEVVFSTLIIVFFGNFLRSQEYRPSQLYVFASILVAILITPLPAIIFTGMEHVLQCLLVIVFSYLSAKALSQEAIDNKKSNAGLLLILSALLTAIRYESLFLIFVVCCLFVLRRRWYFALGLGFAAILPISLFGIYSVLNGAMFFPNSVLVKTSSHDLVSIKGILKFFGVKAYLALYTNPHLLLLLIVGVITALAIFNIKQGWQQTNFLILNIFIFTTIIHLNFAQTGWFYRYEAYLVLLGILAISIAIAPKIERLFIRQFSLKNISIAPCFIFLVSSILIINPFLFRITSILNIPQAVTNIHQQQYQMGSFIQKFYADDSVVANDIGAISYLADPKLIDLVGLGSNDVAKYKETGTYDTDKIANLTTKANAKVAIVYDHWFNGKREPKIPESWIKVAEWQIQNNIVCAGDTVAFYSIDSAEKSQLISNLRNFSLELPSQVKQRIYTQS